MCCVEKKRPVQQLVCYGIALYALVLPLVAPAKPLTKKQLERRFYLCYARHNALKKQPKMRVRAIRKGRHCLWYVLRWKGPEHRYTATIYHSVAYLLLKQRQYRRGEWYSRKALAIREKRLGWTHQATIRSRENLIFAVGKRHRYREELSLLQRQLLAMKRNKKTKLLDLFRTYNNLGVSYQRHYKHRDAVRCYRKSLAILQTHFGATDKRRLYVYKNLAVMGLERNRLQEATSWANKLLQLALLRKQLAAIANAHYWLGFVHMRAGHNKRAAHHHQRALRWYKQSGKHPLLLARSLHAMGKLLSELGESTRGQKLLREAIAIRRKHHAPIRLAESLSSLATVHQFAGRYKRALAMHRRAIAIARRHLGKGAHTTIVLQQNLGLLLTSLGRFRESLALYKRAYKAQRKRFGHNHALQVPTVHSIAVLYEKLKQPQQALHWYRQYLILNRHAHGEKNPQTAQALKDLGEMYISLGRYEEALQLLQRAQEIIKKHFAAKSYERAQITTSLAKLFAAMGKDSKSVLLYQRVVRALRKSFGSKHPKVALSLMNLSLQRLAFGYHATRHRLYHAVRGLIHLKECWRIRIGYLAEAFSLSSRKQRRQFLKTLRLTRFLALSLPRHPALSQVQEAKRFAFRVSLQTKALLSRLLRYQQSRGSTSRAPAQLKRSLRQLRSVSIKALRHKLKPGEALIDIVRYWRYRFHARGHEADWLPYRYAAYILRRDKPLQRIELGRAAQLDRWIEGYRKQLLFPSRNVTRAQRQLQRAAKPLYRSLWKPLMPHIKGIKRLYISPSGPLWRLPIGAILTPKRRYLLETHGIVYVSNGADLLRTQTPLHSRHALIFANPDFGSSANGGQFAPLPGTAAELRMLQKLLRRARMTQRVFQHRRATPQQLLQQLSTSPPMLMHLATHAFFYTRDTSRKRTKVQAVRSGTMTTPRQINDPFQRSGLALAGANIASGRGRLTAMSLLRIPLHQTQLAVLSACETGRGTHLHWEGVVGLRSALQQAGVRSLLMSLWKVPDRHTYYLMRDMYRNLLLHKLPKYKAFHTAQRRYIKRLRRQWGHAHPYFWAAFVFQGDPGALQHPTTGIKPTLHRAGWWWEVKRPQSKGAP